MLNITYTKTKDGWPLQAAAEDLKFNFSGSFNEARINKETFSALLYLGSKTALWFFASLGTIGFAFSAYQGWQEKQAWFLLSHNIYNLTFWVGVFSGCFLWAKKRQEQIQQQALNLLHFDAGAAKKNPAGIDIYSLFSPEAKKVWTAAYRFAKNKNPAGGIEVTALDLFLALSYDPSIRTAFLRLGISTEDLQIFIANYTALKLPNNSGELDTLPFAAFNESLKLHNPKLDPLMLLCALSLSLPKKHIIQAIFFNIDLDLEKLEILAAWIFNIKILSENYRLFEKLSRFKPEGEINRGLTSLPTRYLDRYSQDLTLLAKHGALPLALGRGPDLSEIFRLISQNNANIVIKGAEGSGRSTVIYELAYKMSTEQVPKIWQDKRLVKLELSAIVGQPQKAETALLQSLQEAATAGNIILVLEEIHSLAKTQTLSGLSLLEILINFLQSHQLQIIGTTTLEDYSDYLQNVANFESTFTPYELMALSKSGIMLACCIRASLLEGQNKCFFSYKAIEQAVNLTDLYMKGVSQPQKALSVLVEAASAAKNGKNKIISSEMVQNIVSKKTHIPAQNFTQDEAEKLLHLEQELSKFIVGQSAAVTAVAEGLRRARSGLGEVNRPLASFLFLGPTGVGKTEIARTLAKVYFGEEKYLLRLDMSEYRGAEGLAKLLGTAEKKADTALIKHLKTYPFCLLLLDEFEKAGPEIINLFLQILEDGRLTSGKGELLDLTHALIIATSNAGTQKIQEGLQGGKTLEQIKLELFNRTLLDSFPPELLNRFDGIILFNPLSPEEIQRITYLQLQYLISKLENKGVKINFTSSVVADIAQNAFDPLLGARPIRRYIQDHVESFIAKLLLGNKLERGSVITVDLQNGKLVLK